MPNLVGSSTSLSKTNGLCLRLFELPHIARYSFLPDCHRDTRRSPPRLTSPGGIGHGLCRGVSLTEHTPNFDSSPTCFAICSLLCGFTTTYTWLTPAADSCSKTQPMTGFIGQPDNPCFHLLRLVFERTTIPSLNAFKFRRLKPCFKFTQ